MLLRLNAGLRRQTQEDPRRLSGQLHARRLRAGTVADQAHRHTGGFPNEMGQNGHLLGRKV